MLYDFNKMNTVFAVFDNLFRDMERDLGMGNLLPRVTVPSIKTYYLDQRAVDDGEKITYYTNGRVGRLDGPAVEYHDKNKEPEWWLEGRQVTQEIVESQRSKLEDEKIHHLSIDGRSYEVTGKQLKELKSQLKLDHKKE
jgi:hypothetical protein